MLLVYREKTGCRQHCFDDLASFAEFAAKKPYVDERLRVLVCEENQPIIADTKQYLDAAKAVEFAVQAWENRPPAPPAELAPAVPKPSQFAPGDPGALLESLIAHRDPDERIAFRRSRDGRYAHSQKRGRLVTSFFPTAFDRVSALTYILENWIGGDIDRYSAERRATLRAIFVSDDSWELMSLPEPTPAPIGVLKQGKTR